MKILEMGETTVVEVGNLEIGALFSHKQEVYARTRPASGIHELHTDAGDLLVFNLISGEVGVLEEDTLVAHLPHAVLCPEGMPEGGQW